MKWGLVIVVEEEEEEEMIESGEEREGLRRAREAERVSLNDAIFQSSSPALTWGLGF